MFEFRALPPLSLYIHIPWCVRKCPYCDFNSHELRESLPETAYVDALLKDLEQELPEVWGRTVQSVFIGGGTPSLLSPEALDRLLTGVRTLLRTTPDLEVTLEANPGTVETDKFREFHAAGVNRLSIGIQSFDDGLLTRIGRIHDRRQAFRAAELAHEAGFDNFNLDLMFGLPDQTPDQALSDLHSAMDLEPSHISWYQLTLEPNTYFHSHPPTLPDDDRIAAMQEAGMAALAQGGFAPYEISAYARNGQRCRHNLNYWRFGDYLGIGAGAHGKLTSAHDDAITRYWKHKHPRDYLQQAAGPARIAGRTALQPVDAVLEFMMNALRLREGFTKQLFETHTGLPLSSCEETLDEAVNRGLLEHEGDQFRPTEQGHRFLNELLALFLPEAG